MKQKQHLTIDQSLKVFEALDYPVENIISTVNAEGFTGAEISSADTLLEAIKNANAENGKLILFKVNSETKSFKDELSANNHYVALYFSKNDQGVSNLVYIDPTGAKISPEVRDLVKSNFPPEKCKIRSSKASLQYTNSSSAGGVYQMGGNDYDCGVLVAIAAKMIHTNYEECDSINLDEDSSKELGLNLRKLANKKMSADEVWESLKVMLIDPILNSGSPTKLSGGSLDDDLELDDSGKSDSDYQDSDSEYEEEEEKKAKAKNSLEDSFNKSFSKLSTSEVRIGKLATKSLGTHDDDSSDEEDTRAKLRKYRNVEDAWESFSSPRVYHDGLKYPLTKQADGRYQVAIPHLGSWENLDLSKYDHIVSGDKAVSYVYFGPEEYNKPKHNHFTDQRNKLFTTENYDKLKSSFELHYKGVEALYEERISDKYYAKKSTQLSTEANLERLKTESGSAITKALTTLVLSVNWKDGIQAQTDRLHNEVLESSKIKESFKVLMKEILQKRAFSTRISKDTQIENLRPFSEKIYNELFGADQHQVYSMFGSVANIAIDELRKIGAVTLRGKEPNKYWAPLSAAERDKSYEELVNSRDLPKTKLGKFAWSIVSELDTYDNVFSALEGKKEHLLNDLVDDLSHLTQREIDEKFRSLRQNIISLNKEQTLATLDNLITHNLSNIQLRRKTFSDNAELVQESFSDMMVNIRLSNRSQSRRIKNLQQEEGDKVWSKTVTWAHAFEPESQNHALEKETITSKAGRNSLILDFGKYEEGRRKGNTVTEGIDKLKQDLKIDDKVIAHSIKQIMQGTPASEVRNQKNEMIFPSEAHCSILTNIAGLLMLEFKRNPNFTSFMTLDLIKSGKITWKDALDQQGKDGGMLPMSMTDAMKSVRCLHDIYSPYLPHPYQIQGAEKFDINKDQERATVLDLVTREQEMYVKWNSLHKELQEERDKLQDSREFISERKKDLRKIEKEMSSHGKSDDDKESLKIDIESISDDLDIYRKYRVDAKQKIESLGSDTIEDQIQSESPSSRISLGKTSRLKDQDRSKAK